MQQRLFRQQASIRQGERLWGELILSQPVSHVLITAFLSLITLAAGLFLAGNDYSRKQQVSGYLMPDKGMVTVYAADAGVLLDLKVELGEGVQAGQVLFEIQRDQRIVDEALVSADLLAELDAEQQRLHEQKNLLDQHLRTRLQALADKRAGAERELAQREKILGLEKELEAIRFKALTRGRSLRGRGMLAEADRDALYGSYIEQKKAVALLELQLGLDKTALMALHTEEQSLQMNHARDVFDIDTRVSELLAQQTSLRVEQRNKVTAPISGSIGTLTASAGQMLASRMPVLSIIPEASQLEAHLYIPTAAVGFLQADQVLSIRYDAFPYQKFGVQAGHLKTVSKNVLNPAQLPESFPVNDAVYLARVAIDQQTVTAYGEELALRPGMRLSADVLLDRRSLMEWLLEPLFSIKGRL
ncbi:MAG: HlyD family efflux transporter periplasmic adaptor subunit [Pseudomonadales bacterium]|nr:HlyD family efflux transporter periplasmic adaptor subunit [Pseudomonadales bacterium]